MEKTYKFELPQNREVESTSVRIEDGKVFVYVNFKERFQPEDGDFLVSSYGKVFIYREERAIDKLVYGCYCGVNRLDIIHTELSNNWTLKAGCRFATSAEKGVFLAQLEKECNKRWNAEKKCLEDIYIPKFGDIVKVTNRDIVKVTNRECRDFKFKRDYMICIYPNKNFSKEDDFFNLPFLNLNGELVLDDTGGSIFCKSITPASAKEKQELFDKLAEAGKRWNPETKQLEDIRWIPKNGGFYWYVTKDLVVAWTTFSDINNADFFRVKCNNCFKTQEAAQKVADQIKEIFNNSEV